MEFIEGHSLAAMIQQRGRLTAAETVDIITQCLAGLSHAHKDRLLHRDIKPANTMVTSDGKAKLVDFGLAKLIEASIQSGTVCGSPLYMAPEVWNQAGVGVAADLWAVGVMVFHCIAGRPAFAKPGDILIQEAPPLPLSTADTATHGHVAEVAKVLEFDAGRRHTSADNLRRALLRQ
mmetsp:Transcript_3785/g.8192  ORF Transcript_3785/g.8192 Transcript_3785/m.8192 type:complete len:177 (-) Transcript_3785:63-593(-)